VKVLLNRRKFEENRKSFSNYLLLIMSELNNSSSRIATLDRSETPSLLYFVLLQVPPVAPPAASSAARAMSTSATTTVAAATTTMSALVDQIQPLPSRALRTKITLSLRYKI